jgi:hypothetical protein
VAEGYLLLYFCGSTLLTFAIAAIVLAFFSKDKMSRLAGCFAIKPLVTYSFSFGTWYFYPWLSPTLDWTPWIVVHFVVEICLLFGIVFWFRDLYKESYWLSWLFVFLDFLRLGILLIPALGIKLFGYIYINYILLFLFTMLVAIVSLIVAITRRRQLQIL